MEPLKSKSASRPTQRLSAVGLFAGIGGFEIGLDRAGIGTELLCEIDPAAQQVLSRGFAGVPLVPDIAELRSLPKVDVVVAGFPCQNLSLVGDNTGIFGEQSGLIRYVFQLMANKRNSPRWLVLENVPFMLWHKKGHAIKHVIQCLDALGFRWAYRVIDARSFGLPQRRRRVLIVASRTEDPRTVLFGDDAGELRIEDDGTVPCGFYWTEGRGGLGWAVNGVPTLKGGSAIGIPSPPAIWDRRRGLFVSPSIRDAERMQGLSVDWTDVTVNGSQVREGHRWKMVGNAVSVPMAEWLGCKLIEPSSFDSALDLGEWSRSVWPDAAFGDGKRIHPVAISDFPVHRPYIGLDKFLEHPRKPLSTKAMNGFLGRARSGNLRFAAGFLEACEHYLQSSHGASSAKSRSLPTAVAA